MGIDPRSVAMPADEVPLLELWPEHEVPVMLFAAMLGQWRTGMSGPVGLDLGALPVVANGLRIGTRRQREAVPALLTMEAEALRWFGERAEEG